MKIKLILSKNIFGLFFITFSHSNLSNMIPRSQSSHVRNQILSNGIKTMPWAVASMTMLTKQYSAHANSNPDEFQSVSSSSSSFLPSSESTVSSTKGLILDSPLSKDSFTTLGDLNICRLINGMWQVSGAHGYNPNKFEAVAEMSKYVNDGYTTFDLADIYGPAEEYVGAFLKGSLSSASNLKECQFLTKWVPRPQEITRKIVTDAVDRSLVRMKVDTLDLLQFHWWDYSNRNYYDAMSYLMELHDEKEGKIRNIGLTNFDTEHMVDLIDEGAPIVSNQVSYSILDTRPAERMAEACKEHNVKLLCYGVLLGGFLSSKWLGQAEPDPNELTNVSLRKYYPWIIRWGGWELFQELLRTLNTVAIKHQVSISNVATRWVLNQPHVGGTIIGTRLGYSQHIKDNKQVFSFILDNEDRGMIEAIQKRSRPGGLMKVFGDCGGEYRQRT